MTVYYLRRRHIGLVVDNATSRIECFITGRVEKICRHVAIRELQPANYDEQTYYDADSQQLFLDGLALFDLQLWFITNYKGPPPGTVSASRKFFRAFDNLFGSGCGDDATSLAQCAYAGVVGLLLPGELGYFTSEIVKQHPAIFAAYQRGELGNFAEITLGE